MTVHELIVELKKWPPGLPVVTSEGHDVTDVDDYEDTRGRTHRPNQRVVVLT